MRRNQRQPRDNRSRSVAEGGHVDWVNIAEGSAKQSDREFARYIRISLRSSTEAENHLLLAGDLSLIDAKDFETLANQVEEVRKMLNGFVKRLVADASASNRFADRWLLVALADR